MRIPHEDKHMVQKDTMKKAFRPIANSKNKTNQNLLDNGYLSMNIFCPYFCLYVSFALIIKNFKKRKKERK